MKNSLSKRNYAEYKKNVKEQNYLPRENLQIYFRQFSNKNK